MDYREKCLRKKPEECDYCGEADARIVVHHKDGDRSNNELSNLIPLCQSCHSSVHAGADGYEELTKQLLPLRERKRTVTVTVDKSLSRDLDVVRRTSPVNSDSEAIRYAIEERAETVSTMREFFEQVDAQRQGATETDAQVIGRALSYRTKMNTRLQELLRRAEEEGSLTPAEIVDVLDAEELPLSYRSEWSVGTDD